MMAQVELNVFSLPMRNWNTTSSSFPSRFAAFLAYLWGIETDHFFRNFSKPIKFLAYLWGIETRLCPGFLVRPNEVFSLPMRNWNDTNPGYNHQGVTIVFSLPMRNWNRAFMGYKRHVKMAFLAYLWGIETWMRSRQKLSSMRVFSLPMRNWNPFFEHMHPSHICSF